VAPRQILAVSMSLIGFALAAAVALMAKGWTS
jgi:hypothetical protein